jgi:hypothetical protein
VKKKLTYQQIVKRNRAQAQHPGLHLDPLMKRVHREPHHGLDLMTRTNLWKQPGRRFGPSPMGPAHPKANKLSDRDGNPRIAPLDYATRHRHYVSGPARWTGGWAKGEPVERQTYIGERLRNPIFFLALPVREQTYRLGVTPRQRRRLEHKANHRAAPFGRRAS